MLRRIKVSGLSLSPEFEEGDFVVTVKVPFFLHLLKPGDIVVFQLAPYGRMIKRVQWTNLESKQVYVIGNHPNSIDSRHFGPIGAKNLIGKVIWHIPRPRKNAA
jgi:signal peptidase I